MHAYFLFLALQTAEKTYSEKAMEAKCGTNELFSAGWTVEELQKLIEERQQIVVNIDALLGYLEGGMEVSNPALLLTNIRQRLTSFIRALYHHKRTPATNVYVMMISSEQRQVKPYALPIQLLPYASINETTMRGLIRDILKTMKARGMKVVGMLAST